LTELGVAPWRAMNERFHETILAAAGNSFLADVTERMLSVPMLSRRVVHWYEFSRVRGSHDLHHLIFQAICRRQGERAENLMREHIYQATEIIRDNYEALRGEPLRAAS
jgi:GntR family transcriptional regulator of vanillate catabolism